MNVYLGEMIKIMKIFNFPSILLLKKTDKWKRCTVW